MANDVTEQAIEDAKARGAVKLAQIIYILYLASFLIGFTSIVGLVMAYINKSDATKWLQTHYQFQIRTFWIGFLFVFAGMATMIIGLGYFIMLGTAIWYIVRCVKGMKHLAGSNPIPEPKTWLW
ncbi:MAG: hypothetical protein JKX94_06535 [Sneathiella sp.]|nr:hypothetical protein [Sneathiella sp.]